MRPRNSSTLGFRWHDTLRDRTVSNMVWTLWAWKLRHLFLCYFHRYILSQWWDESGLQMPFWRGTGQLGLLVLALSECQRGTTEHLKTPVNLADEEAVDQACSLSLLSGHLQDLRGAPTYVHPLVFCQRNFGRIGTHSLHTQNTKWYSPQNQLLRDPPNVLYKKDLSYYRLVPLSP